QYIWGVQYNKSLIDGRCKPAIGFIGDEAHAAARDLGDGSVLRGIIHHDDIGAASQSGVEAWSDLRGGIISDDNDSDIGHVSLCLTRGQKKVQLPVSIAGVTLQI